MKKTFIALVMAIVMSFSMTAFGEAAGGAGEAPDYSQASCWYMIPEITKEADTIFIYPTEYSGTNERGRQVRRNRQSGCAGGH